jgi:hypothetical protein
MKPTTPTTDKHRRQVQRLIANEERICTAAGLRTNVSGEAYDAGLSKDRIDFKSAGAKRTAVYIPSEREAFEARWPLLAALSTEH